MQKKVGDNYVYPCAMNKVTKVVLERIGDERVGLKSMSGPVWFPHCIVGGDLPAFAVDSCPVGVQDDAPPSVVPLLFVVFRSVVSSSSNLRRQISLDS